MCYYVLMLDVKVKICGITSVEDAQAALAAGADILGFIFAEQSPRYITIEKAREIARELPPATMRVGVFVNAKVEQVVFALRICDFGGLQFHGEEPSGYGQHFSVPTIKAFRVRDKESLQPMANYDTDYFLLDSYVAGQPGGTGETFNWDLAVEAKALGHPIFLAGGLTAQNVAEAVRKVQPFGVDVSSGVEASPGEKDVQKMRDFVAAVRSAG
jgi:phosphoribosylanthranilate isomerase